MIRSSPALGLDAAEYRLIAQNPTLHFLPQEELRRLIRNSVVVTADEREQLFEQGDEGRALLVVLRGYVKLSATTVSGRETILDVAGPGAVFGELSVLNGWPRSASANTLSACRLVSIDGRQFTQTLLRSPEAVLAMIRLLSERLRTATEQMLDAVDLPAQVRVAKALVSLAALYSRVDEDGLHIELQLSQRELGGMTGLTRESINKHLATLRDSGSIRLSGHDITLLDLAALRQQLQDHARG